jgi:uncharacterized membrane protein YhdT
VELIISTEFSIELNKPYAAWAVLAFILPNSSGLLQVPAWQSRSEPYSCLLLFDQCSMHDSRNCLRSRDA